MQDSVRRLDQCRSLDHEERRQQPARSRPRRSRSWRCSRPTATRRRAQGHRAGCRNNRGGFGQWGATQATVLALKAMTRLRRGDARGAARRRGEPRRQRRGGRPSRRSRPAGASRSSSPASTPSSRRASTRIELRSSAGRRDALPYSLAVEYRSTEPASSNTRRSQLAATLAKSEVKMGETVRMDATRHQQDADGQPMTLARVGLPGGLTFQTWQLKELREKGQIAFFETRAARGHPLLPRHEAERGEEDRARPGRQRCRAATPGRRRRRTSTTTTPTRAGRRRWR